MPTHSIETTHSLVREYIYSSQRSRTLQQDRIDYFTSDVYTRLVYRHFCFGSYLGFWSKLVGGAYCKRPRRAHVRESAHGHAQVTFMCTCSVFCPYTHVYARIEIVGLSTPRVLPSAPWHGRRQGGTLPHVPCCWSPGVYLSMRACVGRHDINSIHVCTWMHRVSTAHLSPHAFLPDAHQDQNQKKRTPSKKACAFEHAHES